MHERRRVKTVDACIAAYEPGGLKKDRRKARGKAEVGAEEMERGYCALRTCVENYTQTAVFVTTIHTTPATIIHLSRGLIDRQIRAV
jgi:hypothetical protein